MMFASAIAAAFCRSYALHLTTRIFLRMRNALVLSIYRKALRVPTHNRDDGQINNLMSSDTQKLVEFSQQVHDLWRFPIIIAVGVYELYKQVGYAAIIGLIVMVVFLPIAGIMTKAQVTYQKNAAMKTDKRVTTVNEFIQGIRVLKYMGWEKPVLRVLDEAREGELEWLKKYVVLKSITFGTLMLVPAHIDTPINRHSPPLLHPQAAVSHLSVLSSLCCGVADSSRCVHRGVRHLRGQWWEHDSQRRLHYHLSDQRHSTAIHFPSSRPHEPHPDARRVRPYRGVPRTA